MATAGPEGNETRGRVFDSPLLRFFTGGLLPRTFAALRHRNFRIYWVGNGLSLIGTWMQNIARGWLVLQLTNSPFLVGLESTVAWLPAWIVSLPAGVLADHFDKRKLLIIAQSLLAVLAMVLAVLTWSGTITIYHILIISGVTGFIVAANSPVRHAIIPDLVGKDDLLNGIALSSAAFNGARIIGPTLAGVALGVIGAGGCFAINSISFLAIIISLLFVRLTPIPRPEEPESVWHRIRIGLGFVARHPDIRVLMWMAGVFASFAVVHIPLMPVFARDVFGAGPSGYGVMMAAVGAGALCGLLVVATVSRTRHKGWLLVGATFGLGLLLLLYSLLRVFAAGVFVLALIGFCQSTAASVTNTLIQSLAPDHVRGRVMSIFSMSFLGMFPLGSLLAGAIAQKWGAPAATLLGGCVVLTSLLAVNLLRPQVRSL